ncbi:MAG: Rrf2 family transcriptional regulator [Candidatus Omnitrophica bacterium]|nr:HTH-type transcriptional regulator IscR [bacterium]NUN95784.1 Rrf2 family transcriptional regulator [Candidatus Omnitrophota bacterium]
MLSQTSRYALRAAYCIAHLREESPIQAREVARMTHIPANYLHKILHDLVRHGILESSRGVGGGFRLKRPKERITLRELIDPFEDTQERTGCPFGNLHCGAGNPCPVHDQWAEILTRYEGFLGNTTLADLAEKPSWDYSEEAVRAS